MRLAVMFEECGLARNRADVTISWGSAGLPSAPELVVRASSPQALAISVKKGPADKVLTRTVGPYS